MGVVWYFLMTRFNWCIFATKPSVGQLHDINSWGLNLIIVVKELLWCLKRAQNIAPPRPGCGRLVSLCSCWENRCFSFFACVSMFPMFYYIISTLKEHLVAQYFGEIHTHQQLLSPLCGHVSTFASSCLCRAHTLRCWMLNITKVAFKPSLDVTGTWADWRLKSPVVK